MKTLFPALALLLTFACSGVSPLAPVAPAPSPCTTLTGYLRISEDQQNPCEDGSPFIESEDGVCLGIIQPVGEWQMVAIYEHHNAWGVWCVAALDLTAYYLEMDCPVPSFCGGGATGYAIISKEK